MNTNSFSNKNAKISKPRPYKVRKTDSRPQVRSNTAISNPNRYAKNASNSLLEEENLDDQFEDESYVSSNYGLSRLQHRPVNACKGKSITSQRYIGQSDYQSNESNNSMVTTKPTFNHPQKKVLNQEDLVSMESDTDDDQEYQIYDKKFTSADLSYQSNFSELSLIVKPSDNPNPLSGGDLSTFDSLQNLPKDKVFNCLSKMQNEFKALECTEEPEEEESFTETYEHLPNYEEIKHFEVGATDDEFMDIVVNNLSKVNGDITYKIFRDQFLPRHRKPTFTDYSRLRRLEKIMLA